MLLRPQANGNAADEDDTKSAKAANSDGRWKFFVILNNVFGFEFLAAVGVAQFMTKGFSNALIKNGQQYVFEEYVVPAPQVALYTGVTNLPNALKPVLGVLSDVFPIYGYTKGPYLALAGLLGCASLGTLSTLQRSLELDSVVLLLFCVYLSFSTVELLSEAASSLKLRIYPEQGPRLMSFTFGGKELAYFCGTIVSGAILSRKEIFAGAASHWLLYSIATGPAAVITFPAIWNWFGEEQLNAEAIRERRRKIFAEKEVLFLCFLMLLSSLVLTYTGMVFSPKLNAIASLVTVVIVLVSFSVLLNPIIAKVNAFSLIQTCLYVNIDSAGFYFVMDEYDKFPDGPHFSRNFYNLVLPLVASLASMLGIWIYQVFSNEVKYTTMASAGNLAWSVLSLLDVLFYSRLSKRAGIDDHVMVLGTVSAEVTIDSWLWMPMVVILAQLCPEGMEGTMYALLAGCHSLGNTISSNFSAYILTVLEIQPHGNYREGPDTKEFDNLWKASLISSLLPVITVGLVPWMIPAKRQIDPILSRRDMPATEGSVLRSWFWPAGVPEV